MGDIGDQGMKGDEGEKGINGTRGIKGGVQQVCWHRTSCTYMYHILQVKMALLEIKEIEETLAPRD